MSAVGRKVKKAVWDFVGLSGFDEKQQKKWDRRKRRRFLLSDADGEDVADVPMGVRKKKSGLKQAAAGVFGITRSRRESARREGIPLRSRRDDEGEDVMDAPTSTMDYGPSEEGPIVQGIVSRLCDCFAGRPCCSDDQYDEDNDDQRPYFTYYITVVQILVLIVSMAVYGVGPFGADIVKETEVVLKPNLAMETDERSEFGNIWLGPSQQDLIHLGAKYSPCMRSDPNLKTVMELDRAEERTTGCCVRDDGSGCVQTIPNKCSTLLSTFVKWNSQSNIKGGYTSGAVCGTDPRYCKKPASTNPFEWDKYDFTNWPVCEATNKPGNLQKSCAGNDSSCHMTCDLLGRPCCFGIQGECMITTREHCEFRFGVFHDDKFLCSQVNCLKEVCGMIPFVNDDIPDQFSRIWSANLLHAGVFHLLLTILFQLFIMRATEIEVGWIRMAFIYFISGSIGTLASCVFLPYQVEVGPSGAQFGVLACTYVDLINEYTIEDNDGKKRELRLFIIIFSLIMAFLFILGILLPYLDNFSHFFGFVSGTLVSLILLRHVRPQKRAIIIIVSLILLVLLFTLLILLFYVAHITQASWIRYLNCPFPGTFCTNMDVAITRGSTYSRYV